MSDGGMLVLAFVLWYSASVVETTSSKRAIIMTRLALPSRGNPLPQEIGISRRDEMS